MVSNTAYYQTKPPNPTHPQTQPFEKLWARNHFYQTTFHLQLYKEKKNSDPREHSRKICLAQRDSIAKHQGGSALTAFACSPSRALTTIIFIRMENDTERQGVLERQCPQMVSNTAYYQTKPRNPTHPQTQPFEKLWARNHFFQITFHLQLYKEKKILIPANTHLLLMHPHRFVFVVVRRVGANRVCSNGNAPKW